MRVVIVMPTGVMVHAKFAMSLAAMVGCINDIEIGLANPRSSIIATSRNLGVREALKLNPDYIMFIDSDMSFPKDSLYRLLAADKDIIGCNYLTRNPPHKSLARAKTSQVSGIAEVDRLPTGMLLIKASVFNALKQPWFAHPIQENGDIGGEDYYFSDKAIEAGYKLFIDVPLSLQIVHWGEVGFAWATNEEGFVTVNDTIPPAD